ncbi:MAG: hypothetical protein IPH85_13615 [Ignavibacteria bacterium]|nr:hypothetical protein [Ignavibacteria bacterium]
MRSPNLSETLLAAIKQMPTHQRRPHRTHGKVDLPGRLRPILRKRNPKPCWEPTCVLHMTAKLSVSVMPDLAILNRLNKRLRSRNKQLALAGRRRIRHVPRNRMLR